jgi:hypothetical protein
MAAFCRPAAPLRPPIPPKRPPAIPCRIRGPRVAIGRWAANGRSDANLKKDFTVLMLLAAVVGLTCQELRNSRTSIGPH